ncbi:MAG: YqeG family HAD IIIA-type phosphatase [Firmicutes bacterium]|nr:YqeG family HAD IIIA-type phosphatase [Bacillota bacterium]
MKELFVPDFYADSIFDIDLSKLQKQGIQSLIIDIDNTLVAWDKKEAPVSVLEWFGKLKEMGFKLCLVSNNTEDRVVKFTEDIDIDAIHKAKKPIKAPFRKAMNKMGSDLDNTAVIGDQIFTDVLGGNRTGLYTVLVVPIEGKEYWWTKFVRNIERHIVRGLKKGENKSRIN